MNILSWFGKRGLFGVVDGRKYTEKDFPSLRPITEVAQEGYERLNTQMVNAPPELGDILNFGASMRHSVFADLQIREQILKAYLLGLQKGKDESLNV